MHLKLISSYLFIVFGLGASTTFDQSWENSNFEDFNEVPLKKVKTGISLILESGVFSEKFTPEMQSYLDDLNGHLAELD